MENMTPVGKSDTMNMPDMRRGSDPGKGDAYHQDNALLNILVILYNSHSNALISVLFREIERKLGDKKLGKVPC